MSAKKDKGKIPRKKAAPSGGQSSPSKQTTPKPAKPDASVGTQEKRSPGHQTSFAENVAQSILAHLMNGDGLNTICRLKGMPAESTVRQWVVDNREGFAAKYARARMIGMDARADRLRSTAEACVGAPAEVVAATRLVIDTEKWYLSKIAPKVYGDKLDLTTGGETLNPTRVIRPANGGGE